ncbi:YcaO-like family protein [Streptomyces sp. NPDC035033]|uniref:YcaO-like family protein n=1 Tax=Streptomyces sp. NPDC035033 TaxID=3155368 RepID=UPI003410ABF4
MTTTAPHLHSPAPGPEAAALKVFTDGTHRVRDPHDTWRLIRPRLAEHGITRVADVTGLDTLGLPVAMAVRPLSRTLAVSQGKGQTPLLAKLSAATEAIELRHAERVEPDPALTRAPATALDLPYDLMDLDHEPGTLITPRTPLHWVTGTDLITGEPVPVPLDAVRLTLTAGRPWQPPGLQPSSNGLASGNTPHEAALHALYEVIERDSLTRLDSTGHDGRVDIDADSVTDPLNASLVRLCRTAGVHLEIALVPNPWQVPCFTAYVWSEDFPVWSAGSGAHSTPSVALSRAITEAAQSRLTAITGTRDDLPPLYHDGPRTAPPARRRAQRTTPTPSAPSAPPSRPSPTNSTGWPATSRTSAAAPRSPYPPATSPSSPSSRSSAPPCASTHATRSPAPPAPPEPLPGHDRRKRPCPKDCPSTSASTRSTKAATAPRPR